MNILLVSYDLMKVGKDYKAVHSYLQGFQQWCKPLLSVYVIRTSKTAATVRDEMKSVVDSNDKVLVIKIDLSNWASYNLADAVNKWLKEH